MAVTRCASSHLMTGLLAWRNPQGREENWISGAQGIENIWKHAGKVVATEIGLVLLTITSTVETVAYSALVVASLTLYPFTDKPCAFFAKLLESSSFTIIWCVADAILCNIIFINLATHESFARFWADIFNPTPIVLLRLDDLRYTAAWGQQHGNRTVPEVLLGRIIHNGRATQQLIDQGANFIQQDVLANASAETIELFKDTEPCIYMFILTKAVYIYAVGDKKNEEIPEFFKPETKPVISDLRQQNNSEETIQELQQLFASPEAFVTAPEDKSAIAILNKLREAATIELQNSLLVTGCWQKAAQQLTTE